MSSEKLDPLKQISDNKNYENCKNLNSLKLFYNIICVIKNVPNMLNKELN